MFNVRPALLVTATGALALATPAVGQVPDSVWRVSQVTAPEDLVRLDTVSGQFCDGSWSVCQPPPEGLSGQLVLVDDVGLGEDACRPENITNGPALNGQVAVIERGGCDFSLKARSVEAHGAVGFVIYNHDLACCETDSTFIWMTGGSAGLEVTIPGVFWARYIRNALLPSLEAGLPLEGRLARVCRPGPCTVDIEPGPITESTVHVARPNPFSTTTEFGVQLVRTQHVTVEVFNTLGQRVALLHDGPLAAGSEVHEFRLDASALPSGVYLYRVTGEDFAAANAVVRE
jgi:hypothetical protein